MNPLESIATHIPPHVRRGHLVGAVQEGEVLDLRRCWTSIDACNTARAMEARYAGSVIQTTVPDVLDFCANQSVESHS